MATLTGTTIQSTYDSLLKVTDNDAITSSLKRITDGLGNNTPLFLSNTAVEISSGLNVVGSITGVNLSGTNTGDETKSSIETKLGAASASNSGYLTSSDWSTFNNKIAGLGTLNRVAKFSSTGSIADSNITDNGSLINISTATTIAGDLTATNIIRAGGNSSQFLKANGSVDSTSYTPTSRTLTINGTTFDLTADRSWTITAGVSGSGTPSRIAMFTSGSTVIGNSQIFQSIDEVAGTMIGIGGDPNAAPILSRLYVNGTSYMAGSITATGAISTSESITASFIVRAGGTAAQLLAANGSVVTAGTNITISGGTISATSGGITSLNGLTGVTQTFATGTSGADFNISSVGTTHTFNIPTASSSTRGLLSAADWVIFANRISGSGTTNFVPKFNGATSLANSLIFDNGTNVGIGTTSPGSLLEIAGSAPTFTINRTSGAFTTAINFNAGSNYASIISNAGTGEHRTSIGPSIGWGGYQTFYTDTVERMRITSGGRVLIGTTTGVGQDFMSLSFDSNSSFSQAINIKDTSSSPSYVPYIVFRNNTDTYTGNIRRWSGSENALYVGGNSFLALGSGDVERMRITSGGAVGIGTTAPNNPLQIHRTTTGTDVRIALTDGTTTNTVNRGFNLIKGSDQIGYLYNYENAAIVFGTNNAERMRITSAGNVGIGNTNPTHRFVLGDGSGTGNQYARFWHSNTDIFIGQSGGTIFGASTGNIYFIAGDNQSVPFGIGTTGNQPFILGTANAERMRITSGGNVGIGTTNPVLALQVEGGRFSVNTISGNVSGTNCTASFRAITGTATDRVLEAYSIGYSALFYLQNNGSYFFAGLPISDARTKKDISYYDENVLEKVMQLKPAKFKYKESSEQLRSGFIAQDVKEIFPDMVTPQETEDDIMGVDYDGMIALLTKAVQELTEKVNRLENK